MALQLIHLEFESPLSITTVWMEEKMKMWSYELYLSRLTLNLYPNSVLLPSEWKRKWRCGPMNCTCLDSPWICFPTQYYYCLNGRENEDVVLWTVLVYTHLEFVSPLSITTVWVEEKMKMWSYELYLSTLTLNLFPHSVLLPSQWKRKWRCGPKNCTCLHSPWICIPTKYYYCLNGRENEDVVLRTVLV